MLLPKWSDLPDFIKNDSTEHYYFILQKKWLHLLIKRLFDLCVAFILLVALSPLLVVIAMLVRATSAGPVLYKQERITSFGRVFRIFKFRTMVENADKLGSLVTVKNDKRVTRVGRVLRRFRLDEIPQLFNILLGQMSFVGTRPEVKKYVDRYSNDMLATLLMPAGVTSLACIEFRDEDKHLGPRDNPEDIYINEILPDKMKYNLEYIEKFNVFYDIKIMVRTVLAVLR